MLLFSPETRAQTASSNTPARPHLYEVRKGNAVSWLFGTFHAGVSLKEFRGAIEPRIAQARTVYFEIESLERSQLWTSDPLKAIETSETLQTKGAPLSQELKTRAIQEYEIPERLARHLRTDSCELFLEALEATVPRLDSEIAMLARELKRPTANLDSDELREQADVIDTARGKSRDCDLVDLFMSQPLDRLKREGEELIAQYLSGTTDDLERTRTGEITGNIYRNLAWVDKLKSPLKRGRVFAAFGVSHLYGERGLLALLKKDGFEVRRVGLDGRLEN